MFFKLWLKWQHFSATISLQSRSLTVVNTMLVQNILIYNITSSIISLMPAPSSLSTALLISKLLTYLQKLFWVQNRSISLLKWDCARFEGEYWEVKPTDCMWLCSCDTSHFLSESHHPILHLSLSWYFTSSDIVFYIEYKRALPCNTEVSHLSFVSSFCLSCT